VLGGQVTIMGHNSRLTAQFDMTSNSSLSHISLFMICIYSH
jgi:hypothetical protein